MPGPHDTPPLEPMRRSLAASAPEMAIARRTQLGAEGRIGLCDIRMSTPHARVGTAPVHRDQYGCGVRMTTGGARRVVPCARVIPTLRVRRSTCDQGPPRRHP